MLGDFDKTGMFPVNKLPYKLSHSKLGKLSKSGILLFNF